MLQIYSIPDVHNLHSLLAGFRHFESKVSRYGVSRRKNIDRYEPAHVIIIVYEACPSSLAILLPEDAGLVDERAEDHRGRYRPKYSNLYPLYTKGERSLIVPYDSEGRGESRHRTEEGNEHVAESEDDEEP